MNFALTNARSLLPKKEAFIDYFDELDLSFAIVSETWLHRGGSLEILENELKAEHGIVLLNRMRVKKGNNNPGGGISIAYRSSKISLKEYPIKRGPYELICAKGKLPDNTRPVFVIGAYLPPKLKAQQTRECLDMISKVILKLSLIHI